jgi:hypothetical protein
MNCTLSAAHTESSCAAVLKPLSRLQLFSPTLVKRTVKCPTTDLLVKIVIIAQEIPKGLANIAIPRLLTLPETAGHIAILAAILATNGPMLPKLLNEVVQANGKKKTE